MYRRKFFLKTLDLDQTKIQLLRNSSNCDYNLKFFFEIKFV